MNISSSSLFRFTTKFEYLKQIISEGFCFRHCVEDMAIGDYDNDPFAGTGVVVTQLHSRAVCFCDLPMSHSQDHRKQYGEYAIAMTKEWAMRKRVTPIRYYHSDSPDHHDSQTRLMLDMLVEAKHNPAGIIGALMPMLDSHGKAPTEEDFISLPKSIRSLFGDLNSLLRDCLEHYWKTFHFTRIYEGEWKDRSTGETTIRRFYDEREWRAVTFDPDDKLLFQFEDIKHIIVTSEAERKEMGELLISLTGQLKISDTSSVWSLIKIGEQIFADV